MALRQGFSLGGYLPEILSTHNSQPRSFLGLTPRDPVEAMTWAFCKAMGPVGLPSPNPGVGCIFVKDQIVIAEGATQAYGGLHGETYAINHCVEPARLKGSTAYIMLEPCSHYGRQPPCCDALIAAGIKACVIGCEDTNPLVQGRGIKRLKDAGIHVEYSLLHAECLAANLPFFFQNRFHRPMVIAKWAQTLSGHLADHEHGSQWISGPSARKLTHFLRQKYDAILVGAQTVIADQPSLNVRDAPWVNRQPLKILFDPSARLASVTNPALIESILTKTFAVGGASDGKVVLIYQKDRTLPPWLALDPSRLFLLEVKSREEAFASMLGALTAPPFVTWYGSGIQSILVEGGAQLLNHLTHIRAIDAFHVFVTPAFLSLSSHQIGPSMSPLNNQVGSMERYELLQGMTIGDDQLLEFMPRDRFEKIFTPVPHVLPTSKS